MINLEVVVCLVLWPACTCIAALHFLIHCNPDVQLTPDVQAFRFGNDKEACSQAIIIGFDSSLSESASSRPAAYQAAVAALDMVRCVTP